MAAPHDPHLPGGAATPTAAERFDPAAFARRLAEARERRARAIASRQPSQPPSGPSEDPVRLRRLHHGFAFGLCLGLAMAIVPAVALLRAPAASTPVAGLLAGNLPQPASAGPPRLPAGSHATTPAGAIAKLHAPAARQQLASAPVAEGPAVASRPLERPSAMRIARSGAHMSARNQPSAPSLPGLVSAFLGQLDASASRFRPEHLIDGTVLRSIGLPAPRGKPLKKNGKLSSKGRKTKAPKNRAASRKH
jgi:hypothetical protein